MPKLNIEDSEKYREKIQFKWPQWRFDELEQLMERTDCNNFNFAARRLLEESVERGLAELRVQKAREGE